MMRAVQFFSLAGVSGILVLPQVGDLKVIPLGRLLLFSSLMDTFLFAGGKMFSSLDAVHVFSADSDIIFMTDLSRQEDGRAVVMLLLLVLSLRAQ